MVLPHERLCPHRSAALAGHETHGDLVLVDVRTDQKSAAESFPARGTSRCTSCPPGSRNRALARSSVLLPVGSALRAGKRFLSGKGWREVYNLAGG